LAFHAARRKQRLGVDVAQGAGLSELAINTDVQENA